MSGRPVPARPTRVHTAHPEPYAGFPYLVTRIGAIALRHVILLPAAWPEGRLRAVARRQATANALPTALCLGPDRSVFFEPDGTSTEAELVPTGIPISGRLVPSVRIEPDPELRERERGLRAYIEELRPDGLLVGDGLEGGRPASGDELTRLAWSGAGRPPGLQRCRRCAELAGPFLREDRLGQPAVIEVRCCCDNPNRCVRCSEPLYERALSAWYWDDSGVLYVAAYLGLSHRCRTGT